MHIYFAILLSLSLSACSWLIDPQFPESMVVDQANGDMQVLQMDSELNTDQMDMMEPVDLAVVSQDAGITDLSVADVGVTDSMVSEARACQNWSTCYAGESCLNIGDDSTGACGPTPNEQICVDGNTMANIPGTRSFDNDEQCCIPDNGENRGECVDPYNLDFDTRIIDWAGLDSPGQASEQFTGGTCVSSIADFQNHADLVFISNIPENTAASIICVEASMAHSDSYDFQLYRLDSCCEQTQVYTEESCGFTFEESDTIHKRFLNMPYESGAASIRLGMKIGFERDPNGGTVFFDDLTMGYKVHASPCCNGSHPCPQEFECNEAGICE